MSFFKKLFGFGGGDVDARGPATPVAQAEHDGYTIAATPQAEGGQFRLAGTISREENGETRQHRLIRADLFPNQTDAADATIRKARQVIDEQGDRLFDH